MRRFFIVAVLLCAVRLQAATFVVNSAADTDDASCDAPNCTLREAIHAANGAPGSSISFAIGSGPATITLGSSLPLITASTTIDATTQPGYSGSPLVSITGPGFTAFSINASSTVVRGFSIYAVARAIIATPATPISNITIDDNAIGNSLGAATTYAIYLNGPVSTVSISDNSVDGRGVTSDGIFLQGPVSNVVIAGNRVTGCTNGFAIAPSGAGSGNVRVGGTTPAERNVAGGNSDSGIVFSSNSPGILVQGNYLGTDDTGSVMNGNGFTDVRIGNNHSAIVENNLMSASVRGVYGEAGDNTVVRGNIIGLHADGVTAFSGTGTGIHVTNTFSIIIGGPTPAERNVIAVDVCGIALEGIPDFPWIRGNYIGLDVNGQPAGNALKGIYMVGGLIAPIIGGVNPGEGNVIGFAREDLILVIGVAGGEIRGNLIGLNAAGTAAAGNPAYGIRALNCGVMIGGGDPRGRNVISGTSNTAIYVESVEGATIQNNYIGTDITGSIAIPNAIGIDMRTTVASNITDNTIAASSSFAIRKLATGTCTIERNRIGTNAAGTAALPNGSDGIFIGAGAAVIRTNLIANNALNAINVQTSNVTVGSTTASDANVITANGGGIFVASGIGNKILGNSIVANGGLGIDLAPAGVNANDAGDADTGANNRQNAPVLSFATTNAGSTSITGTLNSVANETFTIEFFSSPTADPSGFGEGATFVGRISATTDASGNAGLSFVAGAIPGGQVVTATATRDSTGDTSEFSNAVAATSAGTFQFSSPTASVNESAGTVTLTVTRTGGFGVPGSVDYATTDGTAAAGSDYTPTSGTLTFTATDTSRTIVIPILPDAIDEADETFTVTLSNASLGAPSQATVTINDDDPPPTVNLSDASVTEGNSGTTTMTFTVSLSATTTQQVTVDYTSADLTATAGSDYGARSGTLTFAPGQTSRTVAITVNGDTTAEADETMQVLLSGAVNATIGDGQGIGTILNDDGNPSISIGDATVIEGNGGTSTASVVATLSHPSSSIVTVAYATNGNTATSGSDFIAASGTLTFNPGELAKTISVTINGDVVVEGNESFLVGLSNPSNASIADDQAVVTIADDDGSPSLTISNATVNEAAGTATVTVLLAPASETTVTVSHATSDGTALAASDYTAASNALTFNPGETTQSIVVPITNDSVSEGTESFDVTLSSPSNATIAAGNATVTIIDDDSTPSIALSDPNATEGTTATFTVTMSNPSASTVTVNYATANGTASPSDYAGTSGTLTFNPGETSKTVAVATTADALKEPDESFFLNLSTAVNAMIARPQATATIVDDDGTPSVAIGDASVTEGNSGSAMATFTVTLAGSTAQTVTVDYATANGTAVAGSDYATTSGPLVFAAGVTTQTVQVPLIGDTNVETDETFFVNLSNVANALLADNQGLGTVLNDDVAAVVPSISIADVSIGEGNSGATAATLTVTLSAPTTNNVIVDFTTANGTATAGSDYASNAGTVVFAPGVASQTITVAVAGDALVEPNETVLVNLSNATNATISRNQATVTILNDDSPALVPSISISDASVPEGNAGTTNATFTVTLSAATTNTVTVQYATADGTANAGSDYAATSGTLVFASGVTSRTVTVAIAGDVLAEPDEAYFVNLAAPLNATLADGQGAGSIVNDDSLSALPVLSIDGESITEGNSGTRSATFFVALSAPAATVVTVQYATLNGTATAGTDYAAESGTLVFAPGTVTQTIGVAVIGDESVESNETFTVVLSNAVGATIGTARGTGRILNDDQPLPRPSVSVANASVTEGNSGTTEARFEVTLSFASRDAISVDYATGDRTATAGVDYLPVHGTLVFAPGTTSLQIVVPVIGDTLVESDETFDLTVGTVSAAGTIRDDDSGQVAAILVIAGAGPGANGSHFRTTLQLLNASALPVTGSLILRPMNGSSDRMIGYDLQAGEVREIGAQIEESGFVTIDIAPLTGDLPEVSMRVYNDARAAGTSGFTTSLVPVTKALTHDATLIAPANASAMRYNIGMRALSGGASLSFTLRRASGAVAARASRVLGANALVQIAATTLFATALEDNDWIEISVSSGAAVVYGSAVDNITQDPSLQIAHPR